jgi:hypothetical protein
VERCFWEVISGRVIFWRAGAEHDPFGTGKVMENGLMIAPAVFAVMTLT